MKLLFISILRRSSILIAITLNLLSSAQAATDGYYMTNDGVKLHFLTEGKSGPVLVLLPGWSHSANIFKAQLEQLGQHYRVYALDLRGHGNSEKPAQGYHIFRLSKDVHDFLVSQKIDNAILGGHSLGVSVIWGYWELYRAERLSKMIFIDESAFLMANPDWSAQEKANAGAIFTNDSLHGFLKSITGDKADSFMKKMVKSQFTQHYATLYPDKVKAVYQDNLKLPHQYAARLSFNNAYIDWRDVIPTINIPVLIIGGKASIVPWESQVWISRQIKGAQLEIFTKDEGGSHLAFFENPKKFNQIVKDFIESK